jgi:hypothetical protein
LTATELLSDLDRQGIHLLPDGDRLKIKGPKGVLTDSLQSAIQEHKAELLQLLASHETAAPGPLSDPPSPYPWQEHLADLLDLSHFPLLPCEECGGRNFAKGRVKHGPRQWLCRNCIRPLTQAEVRQLGEDIAADLARAEEEDSAHHTD